MHWLLKIYNFISIYMNRNLINIWIDLNVGFFLQKHSFCTFYIQIFYIHLLDIWLFYKACRLPWLYHHAMLCKNIGLMQMSWEQAHINCVFFQNFKDVKNENEPKIKISVLLYHVKILSRAGSALKISPHEYVFNTCIK